MEDNIDYTSQNYSDIYDLLIEQLANEYGDFETFEDEFNTTFDGNGGDASDWIFAEMASRGAALALYLPSAIGTANTAVTDVALGLGGAAASDIAKLLSTTNLATVVDDFGTAAVGSGSPLLAQAQSALGAYARFASNHAVKLAIAGVGSKALIEGLGGDWEAGMKSVSTFIIGMASAELGQSMMSGYAAALADGFVGPVSGAQLAFYGSKFAQAGGGFLLAGAAAYAFGQAWDLAKEIHSGEFVSDYGWFLGKVQEYAEGYIDDVFDGNIGPEDIGDALVPFLDLWNDVLPPAAELPSWVPDILTPWDGSKNYGSPLIVDLDGDGVEATTFNAATTTTFFDLNNDGFAEQTAWVSPHDGLLARDVNENGTIDNAGELFGSLSVDGFAVLAQLDSNGDLLINANDAAWSDLLIWKDANGDAVSQEAELESLSYYNITSINLAGVASSTSTVNGNPISHTSTVTKNGSSAAIADVWFVHDHMNTSYQGEYDLDPRALFLPTLRGFGKMADLHVAMSQDEDLLDLVSALATGFSLADFADAAALDADIEEILFMWAGVEGVGSNSRGFHIDAQHLEFMEEYVGEEWKQLGSQSDPYIQASSALESSYDWLLKTLKGHLLFQAGAHALFEEGSSYSVFAGALEGGLELSEDAIGDLVTFATAPGVDAEDYWIAIAEFLESTRTLDDLTVTEEGWLDAAVQLSNGVLTWAGIKDTYLDSIEPPIGANVFGTSGADTLTGGGGGDDIRGEAGNDTLTGNGGDDLITGGDGNDTLYGNAGNDFLYGDNNNDTLNPGSGGNTASGGAGDDTYVYGGGDDIYTDVSGTEVIVMPTGIVAGDLTISRLGATSMLIEVAGYGTIELQNQINSTSVKFETIQFSNSTTLNLSTFSTNLTTYGTAGNDSLMGITVGAGANDTIYGYGGNDSIEAKLGTNVIDGGDGNDTITCDSGNDTIVASAGFDSVSVAGGTDTFLIPVGYDSDDVDMVRLASSPNDLLVTIAGLGQTKFTGHFYLSTLEYIQYASGGSPISVSSLSIATVGSESGDSVSGDVSGASTNDIMFGRGGNDTITAGAGNDIVDGGDGNDVMYTYNGNDVVYFSKGNDWILESGNSNTDTIRFRAGVDPGTISVYRDAGTSGFWGGIESLIIADNQGNSCDEPRFCAMCGCGNHLAPCADLPS